MKLDTLRNVFRRMPRVKLFVRCGTTAFCAVARSPHELDDGLLLQLDGAVHFDAEEGRIAHRPDAETSFVLTADCAVTRRLQTHRRHLADWDVPADYFRLAMALE